MLLLPAVWISQTAVRKKGIEYNLSSSADMIGTFSLTLNHNLKPILI